MVFYINDPLGRRMPYFPEQDFRVTRRGDFIKAVERFDERPVMEWPKQEEKKKKKKLPPDKDEIQPYTDQIITPFQLMAGTSQTSPLLASQIMSRNVITLNEKQSIKDAWELIYDKHFRHVPIVNDDNHLVGIISDRTISEAIIEGNGKSLLKDIMAHPVISGAPETEISHIAKIFIDYRIGCMPILDGKENLIGMITRSDILRTLVKVAPIEYRV